MEVLRIRNVFSQRVSAECFFCAASVLLMKLLLLICDETLVTMISLGKCGVSVHTRDMFSVLV